MDRAPNAGPTFKPSGMILEQGRIDREARTGNWPNRLVTDYFDDDVKARSNQAALISYRADQAGETTISYGELDNLVSNIAGNLLALGVAKGDVISFQLPNWWEFVAVHLACLRVGAISNPLMPIFRAHELEYMLEHAGSKVLIVPKIFQKFDHQQLANRLQQEIPTLQHVFAVGGEGSNSFESALLAKPEALPAKHSPFTPNDVVQIMYTSGTTGRPKGVMHTSNTLLASACQVARRLQLGPDDVGFMAAPFAHQIGFCFGMIMPIVLGVPLVMMDIWNPLKAAQLISTHRASFTCASTPFMSDLANVPNVEEMDLDCFRMFLTAGAPVYEPVIAKVTQKLKVNVVPGWGMTEVIQATAALPISSLDQPLSDGFAFRGNEVRIVDGEGRSVPTGESGELQCRGSTLFVGYHNKPELYDVDEEGWFDTGDVARLDQDGNIRIVGRSKDIIIRGGENIPVSQIENLIYKMPGIRNAALVAMPDKRLGERGCLFVTLKRDTDLSFDEMVDFLQSHDIARQYLPERLEVLEQMPRTASGKIQKYVLREWAAEFSPDDQAAV